jgi:post-segregation antitoxin (ccd killing protein)
MQVTVDIPDDLAERLKAAGGDLSRRALESFVLEEYKRARLTTRRLPQSSQRF